MNAKTHDIAALLGSRICHDLISPIGAISNGLELLSMTGTGGAEMTLLAESVANANARVQFYRIAYGAAALDQSMGRAEITSILDKMLQGGRLSILWEPQDDCPRSEVKLIYLLIQCFESAMPYGGELIISRTNGQWYLRGLAEKIRVEPGLWDDLTDPDAPVSLSPSQVQFALVPDMLRLLQRRISVKFEDQEIQVSF